MTNDEERFFNAHGLERFTPVKHNERDFEAYREFQQQIDKTYEKVEKAGARAEREANLRKWIASQTTPWSEAKLSTLRDQKAAQRALTVIKEQGGLTSFFITGGGGSGKTFLALAIIRRFIGLGLLLPSQVRHTSEEEVMALASNRVGFRYNEAIGRLLSPKYKAFIVDNVGSKKVYKDEELAVWSMFFDYVSRRGLIVLFTSALTSEALQQKFASQDALQAKFAYLVAGRSITMNGEVAPPLVQEARSDIDDDSGDEAILAWS